MLSGPLLIITLTPVTPSCSPLLCVITWAPCPFSYCPARPSLLYPGGRDMRTQMVVTQISNDNDNIHSPAVRPHFWALITDLTLPSPPGPSTPPEELQLTTLDSSSVLVSWHPPLEPNGIIISYWILYSGNLSEPEHLWKNVSQDGGCFFSRHINSIKCIFYFYIYSNICSLYERTHYFAFF